MSEAHTTLVEFNYTNNLFKMKLSSWIKRSKKNIFGKARNKNYVFFGYYYFIVSAFIFLLWLNFSVKNCDYNNNVERKSAEIGFIGKLVFNYVVKCKLIFGA